MGRDIRDMGKESHKLAAPGYRSAIASGTSGMPKVNSASSADRARAARPLPAPTEAKRVAARPEWRELMARIDRAAKAGT